MTGSPKRAFRPFSYLLGLTAAGALMPEPARSDAIISGPPCIMDGNTLQVGGAVKDGQCWGGITVRLHGSTAPELTETCQDSKGVNWACGQEARVALVQAIRLNEIACYHLDGEFDDRDVPLATCLSGRNDLSLLLVQKGLARMPTSSDRYRLEEQAARRRGLGLWR
ncbi:MAG: thermonuclease family protein [Rhodobacterales bacterium]|nr:thermonuclease family protein [Rhodobacterales bacterium]